MRRPSFGSWSYPHLQKYVNVAILPRFLLLRRCGCRNAQCFCSSLVFHRDELVNKLLYMALVRKLSYNRGPFGDAFSNNFLDLTFWFGNLLVVADASISSSSRSCHYSDLGR